MTLTQELEKATEQQRAQALADYRQLLGRYDKPHAGDVTKLAAVLDALSLTLSDFDNDRSAIDTVARHEKQLVPDIILADARKRQAVAVQAVRDERDAEILRQAKAMDDLTFQQILQSLPWAVTFPPALLQAWVVRLGEIAAEVGQLETRHNQAMRSISETKWNHPRVFGR